MFSNLPPSLQRKIIFYLTHNNFPLAKELYENWKNKTNPPKEKSANAKK